MENSAMLRQQCNMISAFHLFVMRFGVNLKVSYFEKYLLILI